MRVFALVITPTVRAQLDDYLAAHLDQLKFALRSRDQGQRGLAAFTFKCMDTQNVCVCSFYSLLVCQHHTNLCVLHAFAISGVSDISAWCHCLFIPSIDPNLVVSPKHTHPDATTFPAGICCSFPTFMELPSCSFLLFLLTSPRVLVWS